MSGKKHYALFVGTIALTGMVNAVAEVPGVDSNGFVHPGVVVGAAQLSFVRTKVAAEELPWKTFFQKMQLVKPALGTEPRYPYASLQYVPHAAVSVTCPSGNSANAPLPCIDEMNDSVAAYAAVLMFNFSQSADREKHAEKAVKILNAWAATFKTRVYNGPTDATSNNAYLQASWTGSNFAKAAELLRYTYTPAAGKPKLNVAGLTAMFEKLYIPYVQAPWNGAGANWLMSFNEAAMNIAVFTSKRDLYNNALQRWRRDVPTVSYMTSDQNPAYPNLAGLPMPPKGTMYDKPTIQALVIKKYWYNPTRFVDGLEGETCRDAAHMVMGYGPLVNMAETARLQGVDLYSEIPQNSTVTVRDRLVAGIELNASYINSFMRGQTPSNWACPTVINPRSTYGWQATFETAYNALSNRQGVSMPHTDYLLRTYSRPSNFSVNAGMVFEALTSYGTP